MSGTEFDDETLMAFADGEADPEIAARIEAALETDDALMARLALFMETRARTAEALKPLIDEPVPGALTDAVRAMIDRHAAAEETAEATEPARPAAPVISLAERAAARKAGTGNGAGAKADRPVTPPARMPIWQALAASLLVVAGGAGGYLIAPKPQSTASGLLADPAVFAALSSTASGASTEIGDGRLEPVLSFRKPDGTFCREFRIVRAEGGGMMGLACHEDGNWKTHLAMATTRPQEGFVPAGSTETLDAYLDSIEAGPALSADEERAALAGLTN